MEALILLLIGLVTGHVVASNRHPVEVIHVEARAVEATEFCAPTPESTWVANLDNRSAPRWLVQEKGGLCVPATGEQIVLEDLRYEERR